MNFALARRQPGSNKVVVVVVVVVEVVVEVLVVVDVVVLVEVVEVVEVVVVVDVVEVVDVVVVVEVVTVVDVVVVVEVVVVGVPTIGTVFVAVCTSDTLMTTFSATASGSSIAVLRSSLLIFSDVGSFPHASVESALAIAPASSRLKSAPKVD